MHRIVTTIAIGLAVAAGCLGATMALGDARADDRLAALLSGERACQAVPADAPGNRTLDWDGSDHVTLAVPGHAVWHPGGDDKVHVSGDPRIVAHLRVRDGVIESDCSRGLFVHQADLRITLPGRSFRRVHVAGSGDLALHELDQQSLEASISGSGDIKADGKLAAENIHIAGSGNADFSAVASAAATLRISGSGNVDVTATHAAQIRISGSGDVTLRGNPPIVTQHISGSGDVRRIGA